eukprot:SAG31_NODE_3664_length_4009_cov_4.547570_3_plen_59_part_00
MYGCRCRLLGYKHVLTGGETLVVLLVVASLPRAAAELSPVRLYMCGCSSELWYIIYCF